MKSAMCFVAGLLSMTLGLATVGCDDGLARTNEESDQKPAAEDDSTPTPNKPVSSSSSSSSSSSTVQPQSLGCGAGEVPSSATQLPLTVVMGGEPPKVQGGDPKGTWLAEKATLYLPKAAALKYSEKKSGGKAKAWGVFDEKATRIQIAVDLELTSDRGDTEKLNLTIEGNGGYAAKGETLDIAWSCPQKLLDPSVDATFSATGGRGVLVQKLKTSAGDAFFVIDASKK
jgi:hypothetical protein